MFICPPCHEKLNCLLTHYTNSRGPCEVCKKEISCLNCKPRPAPALTRGKETNIAVAEQVLGWHRKETWGDETYWCDCTDGEHDTQLHAALHSVTDEAWSPSTEIKDAWPLLRRFRPHAKIDFRGVRDNQSVTVVTIYTEVGNAEAYDVSACQAICLAALEAQRLRAAAVARVSAADTGEKP